MNPSAKATPQPAITRPVPWRSAIAPMTGVANPQISACAAIAKLRLSSPQPSPALAGEIQSP